MLRRLYSHSILSGHPGYWLLLTGVLGTTCLGHAPVQAFVGSSVVTNSAQAQRQPIQTSQTISTSSDASNRPVLQAGARGSDISELQATLQLLGFYSGPIDGVYTQPTAAAVSQFQRAAGLTPDGIVGPATWNRLYPAAPGAPTPTSPPVATAPASSNPVTSPPARPTPSPKKPTPPPKKPTPPVAQTPPAAETFPVLRKGMKGPAVVSLQERLQTVGLLKGGADGVFGDETEAAVKAAQEKYGLEVDGIVGPATWGALIR